MKKVFSLVVALMLSVCLAVTASAAGSITSDIQMSGGLEISKNPVVPAAAEAIHGDLAQVLQDAAISIPSGATATPVFLQDLDGVPGKTYTFTIESAGPNDLLIVLHWNGGNWEWAGEAYGNTVEATFKSFSPVAIILVKNAAQAPAAAAAPAAAPVAVASAARRAPQTGDSMAIPFLGFAVIAVAGIVAFKARKKEM